MLSKHKMLALTLLTSLSVTLIGCETMTGSSDRAISITAPKVEPVKDSFCLVAKPIYWADGDTDDTIKQVKEHNAVYKRLCTDPPQ